MDLTVAFQGVPGSHSEQAVRQHFGDEVTLLARPRFADLFDVLEESLAHNTPYCQWRIPMRAGS